MNRFKCPACGGNQYTSANTAEGCIYCGHKELEKMEALEPEESEGEEGWLKRLSITGSVLSGCGSIETSRIVGRNLEGWTGN